MASRPLIKDSLMLLHVCGLDPHKRNVWSNARTVLVVVLVLVLLIDVSLKSFLKWEGLISVDEITIIVGLYQVLMKICTLINYRKKLGEVIRRMEMFRPMEKYGQELKKEIENVIKTVRNSGKFMLVLLVFVAMIYISQSFISSTRRLPYSSYHPVDLSQSPNYEIVFALQVIVMFFSVVGVFGFDGLFVGLSINIACELKVVKESFQNVRINPKLRGESKTNLLDVYRAIDHHNLVLLCIKEMQDIYSILLLNVYINSLFCICLGLLGIIATGFPPSLENFSKYGLVVVFYVLQLFFYCVTGSCITTESEDVAAAVYNTDWWVKTQPELRRAYVLVIERSNKAEKLTAGGMFVLNLDSFTKIVRSALSFFTLVQAIYNDS